jgi:hypothetical protein
VPTKVTIVIFYFIDLVDSTELLYHIPLTPISATATRCTLVHAQNSDKFHLKFMLLLYFSTT